MRDSVRTSPAAYWASWADSFPALAQRFPRFGADVLAALESAEARGPAPACVTSAVGAAHAIQDAGFSSRPSWSDLLAGVQPERPDQRDPGEWAHGWQYHASHVLEQNSYTTLLSAWQRCAATRGDAARLRSSAGPHSGAWMTIAPTTPGLRLGNTEMLCALRRRLGWSVSPLPGTCEGCGRQLDAQGHHRTTCTRTGRNHARHRSLLTVWRQIFIEAGGQVPFRNVERMLRASQSRLQSAARPRSSRPQHRARSPALL